MSYILRAINMGKETMPAVGDLVGIPVYTSEMPFDTSGEYAFRWGCTSCNLGQTKVVNKIGAINEVADKKAFREKLAKVGLAPSFYPDVYSFFKGRDVTINDGRFGVKYLARPAHHSRSKGMYLIETFEDLIKIKEELGSEYYISEFIKKSREYRVFVAQGRIVFVIEKTPKDKNELSWGCVDEGSFKYVDWSEWPKNVVQNALLSFGESSLDFGAIDIIVDDTGATYSLEINTAPYLTPYYIKCVAKVFKHIIKNGRDRFDSPSSMDWKDTIHPAITKDLSDI